MKYEVKYIDGTKEVVEGDGFVWMTNSNILKVWQGNKDTSIFVADLAQCKRIKRVEVGAKKYFCAVCCQSFDNLDNLCSNCYTPRTVEVSMPNEVKEVLLDVANLIVEHPESYKEKIVGVRRCLEMRKYNCDHTPASSAILKEIVAVLEQPFPSGCISRDLLADAIRALEAYPYRGSTRVYMRFVASEMRRLSGISS